MKLSIAYDNNQYDPEMEADWGFSCVVDTGKRKILFDTGYCGPKLLRNLKRLNIDPKSIKDIFISHAYGDHIGGLEDFLSVNPAANVYAPPSYEALSSEQNVTVVKQAQELCEGVYSTGELDGKEQSMGIMTPKGIVVIAGASHAGVPRTMEIMSQFGETYGIVGGLHDFKDANSVEGLQMICPTHCSCYKSELEDQCPDKYVEGGVGKVIEI